MKTTNNIISYMLLGLSALALFAGCRKESEMMPLAQEEKSVTIELSVSTADISRATPTEMESAINSLRIYAFRNGKRVGYLYREVTTAATPFYMDLELPESGRHDVEFYLIANEAEMANESNGVVSLSDSMSREELEAILFTGLRNGVSLPMYERMVAEIDVEAIKGETNSANGHEDHFVLSQRIDFLLHRSIAKLSLYGAKVHGASSNPQILNVELLAAGTRQYNYLFPQEEAILNAIPSRANNRSLLSSVVTVTNEVVKGDAMVQNPNNYTEIISGEYLSEVAVGSSSWSVPSSSSNAAVLHIEYSLGENQAVKNEYLYLPVLERNHHLKVCILFTAEGGVAVNYEVADWDDNMMSDYHFDYPTHSYLMEVLPTTENIGSLTPSSAATMAEGRPFKGYFQMSKPTNDAWTPTLLGLNGSNCEVIVYDVESGDEVTTFPIQASERWYRIEVWPLGGKMEVGKEVKVAISYVASGLSESEFLLINGSNLSYYWPYAGESTQDANYVIITMVN